MNPRDALDRSAQGFPFDEDARARAVSSGWFGEPEDSRKAWAEHDLPVNDDGMNELNFGGEAAVEEMQAEAIAQQQLVELREFLDYASTKEHADEIVVPTRLMKLADGLEDYYWERTEFAKRQHPDEATKIHQAILAEAGCDSEDRDLASLSRKLEVTKDMVSGFEKPLDSRNVRAAYDVLMTYLREYEAAFDSARLEQLALAA